MTDLGRMSTYPLLPVTERTYTKDAHGNITDTVEVSRELPFVVHAQKMFVRGAEVLSGAWLLLEGEEPNKDKVYVHGGLEYSVLAWNTFNDYGIIHYQVFLQ